MLKLHADLRKLDVSAVRNEWNNWCLCIALPSMSNSWLSHALAWQKKNRLCANLIRIIWTRKCVQLEYSTTIPIPLYPKKVCGLRKTKRLSKKRWKNMSFHMGVVQFKQRIPIEWTLLFVRMDLFLSVLWNNTIWPIWSFLSCNLKYEYSHLT